MGFAAEKILFRCVPWVIVVCIYSGSLSGQNPAGLDPVAVRAAEGVAETHQQRIFIASQESCLFDMELCASFESSLRADLEKMVPGAQFVDRKAVVSVLADRGFIALDAYIPYVLRLLAPLAGVETLVTDSLLVQPDGYILTCEVDDLVHQKKLDGIQSELIRAAPESGGEPLVFTDPESRTSVIIPRARPSRPPGRLYPQCERCPDPSYTRDARAHRVQGVVVILGTITEQGLADHIVVIKGLADGLTDKAVEAVRRWHFRPAIGKDGKPFAVRQQIEVTFRRQ